MKVHKDHRLKISKKNYFQMFLFFNLNLSFSNFKKSTLNCFGFFSIFLCFEKKTQNCKKKNQKTHNFFAKL